MGNSVMKLLDVDSKNSAGMGGNPGGPVAPINPDLPPINTFQMPKDSPGTSFSLQKTTNNPQSTSHAYLQKFA